VSPSAQKNKRAPAFKIPLECPRENIPPKDTLNTSVIAQVAVPLPIPTVFSYSIPDMFLDKAIPGVRATVPFRNTEITGYIVAIDKGNYSETITSAKNNDSVKPVKIKPLIAILDDQPVLSAGMLQLTKYVAEYYGSSWGEAIENALPRWVKYGKKVEKYLEKASKINIAPDQAPSNFELSEEQHSAFEIIRKSIGKEVPAKPILIYGVTGSGKSELYIRAIRETLTQNRAAICLVPEIALTEQLQRFFAGHFGDQLEILHSKMTDGERFLTWKRIEIGTCKVVLGPRSAVFAPVPHLGLIIMDEEHEGSYKQETTPRYHAREVASWRAQNENALFLMGTATPSLESMALAEQGMIERIDLTRRIDLKAMPKVDVIDLKRYQGDKRPSLLFSPPLMREIETNLKNKEGTMLLLNRRGFSTSIRCPSCAAVEECKHCQVSLTFHQESNQLLCHYCNYQKKVPAVCGECKSPLLRFMGFGTEKVESEVARFFPSARIARLDADTTQKKDSHSIILEKFRKQEIDVLIGTQMIAKGFDFPNVTLVGVVLADVGLRLPDFRSSERTFQLLTQFAGRAGRGTKPGRVIIQTWMPEHPSIRFAKEHDFLSFYAHEKKCREEFHYPPYRSLANIIIRSHDEKKAYLFAREIRDALRKELDNPGGAVSGLETPASGHEIIGPAPLPFYKLRGHFRWHVMLKIPTLGTGIRSGDDRLSEGVSITARICRVLMNLKKPSSVAFQLDVDPLNIL